MKVTTAAAKMVVEDEWVTTAMTGDQMVAELLIRLKHAGTVVLDDLVVNLPPLWWGIRKRRSRSFRFCGGGILASVKKDVDSAKASPKTQLSWSGGSGSGGVSTSPSAATTDGFEDTSRQASSTITGSGSKVFITNEITSSFSKRLKNNKSSSKLKDEENLKMKEIHELENEIANLRATFDEHNVKNQRLKRIKLNLNSGRVKKETPVNQNHKSQPESKSYKVESKTENQKKRFFFLPDLNMVPTEDEILIRN